MRCHAGKAPGSRIGGFSVDPRDRISRKGSLSPEFMKPTHPISWWDARGTKKQGKGLSVLGTVRRIGMKLHGWMRGYMRRLSVGVTPPPTASWGGGGGATGYPCENFKKPYIRNGLTYSDDRKFFGELRAEPTVWMILTPSQVESKIE